MLQTLRNRFFLLIVFLMPINLGKHVISSDAYVKFHLIDYLIPTLWLIDILVLLFVFYCLLTTSVKNIYKSPHFKLVLIFLFSQLPSLVIAVRPVPALYSFLSLALHVFFALAIARSIRFKNLKIKFLKVCTYSVALITILAFIQWFKQSSVFDNYMYFGEQPYSITTKDIHTVNYSGEVKIPPYSLFRHPNIFGGYLSILLVWLFYTIFILKISYTYSKEIFFLGVLCLFLTFSVIAILSFMLGILALLLITHLGKRGVKIALLLTAIPIIVGVAFPLFSKLGWFQDNPSVYRRSNLSKSAYMIIEKNVFFGGGLNNFTVLHEEFLPSSQILRFIQPVHNIFLLIWSESGIFTLLSFIALLIYCMRNLLEQHFGFAAVLFVSFLQFLVLGSFDHYLTTIHQMQILFWLTVGLSLTYTNVDVEVQN